MMIEGSGPGSMPLTSGSGSGRPKNMWIRIRLRNTVIYNPSHAEFRIYVVGSGSVFVNSESAF
jgi:hypothetical protein